MQQISWKAQLEEWTTLSRIDAAHGAPAAYIPALRNTNASALGICLLSVDGHKVTHGDWDTTFTLQSVSKVINFIAACESRGMDTILQNVDVEPTGDAFDSIIRLEVEKPGKPFNPMINAGAITVASMLPGQTYTEKFHVFVNLLEKMLGRPLTLNNEVYESEMSHAHRNRALAHYLMGLGYLDSDVEDALKVYTMQCAVEVTTADLAEIGLLLSLDGYHAASGRQILSKEAARVAKSLMMTCGMYNASGKVAAFVGIPAKSGVSGAILATVPRRGHDNGIPFAKGCGIGIYGPAIDDCGNSTAGLVLLRHLSSGWDLNIY